jgi:hypothetical protein
MARSRFSGLYRRLCAAGVAARHARRAVGELEGHHQQLVAEACARGESSAAAADAADRLLGSDAALIEQFASRPELRALARRRPAWSFGVLPALGLIALVSGLFVAVNWLPALEVSGEHIVDAALAVKGLTLWLGPVLLSVICTALAYRYRMSLRWPLLTVVLVCAVGTLIAFQASYDASGPTPVGSLGLGIGFPPSTENVVRGVLTLAASMVPVLIVALRRDRFGGSGRS